MRKQFIRLFFGFASVALLVLLIQVGVFFLNEAYQRRAWSESVFEEYHRRFSLLLEEAIATNTLNQQTLHRALLSAMDDRISGV
ncbi:MAG TPA: sensor histidine kinase, partial [Sphaerochaeta sp.]|nr:sensor histidine kinase [Sphaerochaeta sp.]